MTDKQIETYNRAHKVINMALMTIEKSLTEDSQSEERQIIRDLSDNLNDQDILFLLEICHETLKNIDTRLIIGDLVDLSDQYLDMLQQVIGEILS